MKMSCKEASLLVDKKISSDLSIKEWVSLKIHLSMCEMCSIYYKQSKIIDEAIKSRLKYLKYSSEVEINSLKERIKSKLNDLK